MSIADIERAQGDTWKDARLQRLRSDLEAAFNRAARSGVHPDNTLDVTFGFALGVMIQLRGPASAMQSLPLLLQNMQVLVHLAASPEAQGTA